ncbi:hypothetical protein H0H92_014969 [Tricholoma furcatifolium]|nr:hypothetical protein H0H92_014969 [Tricholoma furcatifolium]
MSSTSLSLTPGQPLPPWTPQNESSILEPYTYITSAPGKEFRTQLIEAFNLWLDVPPEKLKVISGVVNMLHSSSLLIDDIEDDSQLRRGQPVAHKIYGIPQTINTANYNLFALSPSPSPAPSPSSSSPPSASTPTPNESASLLRLVNEELLSLHRGQGLEILWRDSLSCPSEEEYIAMVNNKTGGLLRIGIKLMMACATRNRDVDYVPLVNLIGVYFQIRDDLMNLDSTEYTKNKGFAEDLTEGKFSFPVVHGIHADKSNRQILNVLQKRPTTPTLKTHTITYLRTHTRSFEYTRAVLRDYEGRIREELGRLGGNERLAGILDWLSVNGQEES